MFEDNETSMGGLVLECYICQRLLIFPTHRPECLKDWNKHGRVCLKCLLFFFLIVNLNFFFNMF